MVIPMNVTDAHSEETRHWTHVLVAGLQWVMPAGHVASLVHVAWHVLFAVHVNPAPPSPQFAAPTH